MAKVHKVTSSSHSKAPMTMKKWEGSPADMAMDKKMGYKEGSKADTRADKAAVRRINKGK